MSWIILITFVSAVLILIVAKYFSWRRTDRTLEMDRIDRIDSAENGKDAAMLEHIISSYEIKFIGAAITKMMSERKLPFTIRNIIWKKYPREYGDPVVGVSAIAKELSIPSQRVYSLLSAWFAKRNVLVDKIGLDGDCLRNYLHKKALVEAMKIIEEISRTRR